MGVGTNDWESKPGEMDRGWRRGLGATVVFDESHFGAVLGTF
jgi:hypothetical protein